MSERRTYIGCYFLDTSTLISRNWDDPPTKARIQSDLQNKECYSSVYVRCQYQMRIVNSLIFIHSLVKTCGNFEEAQKRVEKNRGDPDDLTYQVALRLFRFAKTTEEVMRRLERWIESEWHIQFDATVRHDLCDLTKCRLGDGTLRRRDGHYWVLDRCPRECGIHDFWVRQAKDLRVLANLDATCVAGSKDHKGTLSKVQGEARKIIDGQASPQGKACREALDDSIIAIEARECHPGITVHTRDQDFEVLKPFLRVDVKVLR